MALKKEKKMTVTPCGGVAHGGPPFCCTKQILQFELHYTPVYYNTVILINDTIIVN